MTQLAAPPRSAPEPDRAGPIVSSGAGFLVHRSARFHYPFYDEGLQFSRELVGMLNKSQEGHCSTTFYREAFGAACQVHWFVMLRSPHDYKRLLELVDHSEKWREWAAMDRLPEKGHGAWDRIFVEGSITERVICPQHGVGVDDHDHEDHHDHDGGENDLGFFQPPASGQSHVPSDRLLHTANDGALIHRMGRVYYRTREEARFYLFRWAQRITEGLEGIASAYSFEEMWGVQDRLHAMVHLRNPEDQALLEEFERTDPEMQEIKKVAYAPGTPGEGQWPYLFVPETLTDTLLIPEAR